MSISSRSSTSQILQAYDNAEIVTPPAKLSEIYSCKEQTEQTKLNLAASYSFIVKNDLENKTIYKNGLQLFEIPFSEDNCQSYCGIGYGPKRNNVVNEWWNPDKSWVELSNIKDVSCHKGFEKVFQYGCRNNHLGRQWGDGTILHKAGCTVSGASPVYRVIDSNQPFIKKLYGDIQKIWVKPYPKEVPKPYLRWQSTHYRNFVGDDYYICIKPLSFDILKALGDQKFEDYYHQMNKESEATPKASVLKRRHSFFYKNNRPEEQNEKIISREKLASPGFSAVIRKV